MIRIKVVFHGSYREVTGLKKRYFELPEKANLFELLKTLEEHYGREFTGQLIDYKKHEIWPLMAIAVNGNILSNINKFNCFLKENDEIIFLSPSLGG